MQFSTELAFDLLADHREQYPTFNDDIQGTAAVSLAGLINAIAQSGTPLKEQRIVFFGAGSAGVGIARLIAEWFVQQGVDEQTSKDMITLVDSKGLVANNRGDKLPSHKVFFSKASPNAPKLRTLYEVVDHYRPTCLLGLSTVKSAFNERVLKKMAELNKRPIVFALSNPLTQAECTFEEAVQWTNGNVLFASGSPFPNVTWQNRALVNNQGECTSQSGALRLKLCPATGNNVYIFPGLGLGTILAKCKVIPEALIHTSANALASAVTAEEKSNGMLYPRLERIREVSSISASFSPP